MAIASAPMPRAIVLDDDPAVRRMVARVLAEGGYEALPVASTGELLHALRAEPQDAIILDLALGLTDAVEVLRDLALRRFPGTVLLISGQGAVPLSEVARVGSTKGLRMLKPLEKPFRAAELMARLGSPPDEPTTAAPRIERAIPLVDLRAAIASGWAELWYQPKIDLATMQRSGAEALLRVRHPEDGIIMPANVLPPPGDAIYWTLANFVVARAMADWRFLAAASHPLRLAINMPVSIVMRPDFLPLVRDHLPRSPDFPGLLVEITEDEVIAEPDLIREMSAQLSIYGVGLSIDDVGSGYAALSRLLDVPFAEVKLDRAFVANCSSDPSRRVICQTIVDIAHRVGALACAEGVETDADADVMRAIGCDRVQGFLFGRPAPRDELLAALNGPLLA